MRLELSTGLLTLLEDKDETVVETNLSVSNKGEAFHFGIVAYSWGSYRAVSSGENKSTIFFLRDRK